MSKFKKGDLFELTADHVTLLRAARVQWQDDETGAPEIDPKRPYGNSDVADDVIELLGLCTPGQIARHRRPEYEAYSEERRKFALDIHRETTAALQIVLGCQTFEPGAFRYISGPYESPKWERTVERDSART